MLSCDVSEVSVRFAFPVMTEAFPVMTEMSLRKKRRSQYSLPCTNLLHWNVYLQARVLLLDHLDIDLLAVFLRVEHELSTTRVGSSIMSDEGTKMIFVYQDPVITVDTYSF